MKSKKELGQEKLRTWEEKLQCPLCQSDMKVIEEQLVCRNYHTFDLAKQGYVNLFPEHQEENYSQTLFEARYHLMNLRNFYKGLHEQLYLLLQENNLLAPSQFIIDLGTGEGDTSRSFTEKLCRNKRNRTRYRKRRYSNSC